jgi:hypothetical protein
MVTIVAETNHPVKIAHVVLWPIAAIEGEYRREVDRCYQRCASLNP